MVARPLSAARGWARPGVVSGSALSGSALSGSALSGSALLCGMLASCAPQPSDPALLAQALAVPGDRVEEAFALCDRLSDADQAGACALSAARRAGRAQAPETLCPQVPEGAWRSECWFLAAEDARRRRDDDRAGELCAQAGPFVHDCGQHLWQTALQQLSRGHRTAQLVEVLPQAQALYARWDALLGEQSDLQRRYWMRFFGEGFDTDPSIDVAACGPFPEALQVPCRQAAAQLYLKRLRELSAAPGGLEALCTLPEGATVAAAGHLPGLSASAHPGLQAALDGARAELCTGGEPRPDHQLVERVLEAAAGG